MDSDFPLRMAGTEVGVDLRAGLRNGSLDELRRAARTDRVVPGSLMRDFHATAPERSEPGYTLSGRYQPEVAYGA